MEILELVKKLQEIKTKGILTPQNLHDSILNENEKEMVKVTEDNLYVINYIKRLKTYSYYYFPKAQLEIISEFLLDKINFEECSSLLVELEEARPV